MSKIMVPETHKGLPVKEIKERAFYGREDIEEIVIAEGTTKIGKFAFANSNIVTITIPSSVKIIQENAFEGCTKLAKINYEGRLEDWCKIDFSNEQSNPQRDSSIFYIKNKYGNLEKLGNILNFPCSLKEVKNYSFARFSFQQINIPEGVNKIGIKAFFSNIELNKVVLPNTVKIIDDGAFQDDTKLFNINFPTNLLNIGKNAFSGCTSCSSSLELAIKLEEIGEKAFFNYGGELKITEWVVPGTVKKIGDQAFSGMGGDSLIKLSIPACGSPIINYFQHINNSTLNPLEHVTTLNITGGKILTLGMLKNFVNLSHIDISNSVQVIEREVFGEMPLKNIALPFINQKFNNLFSKNYQPELKIEEIKIRAGTSIPNDCFMNYNKAIKIDLPDSIQTIGMNAFYGCGSLKEIYLSKNLKSIGSLAFYDCRLEKVYYDGDYNDWCRTIIDSTPMSKESKTQFLIKDGERWKEELEVRITDPRAIIRGAHFKNFVKMKSFKAMHPTITMSNSIFENCDSLEDVQFSKMITPLKTAFPGYSTIGYFPYSLPDSLQHITVLDGEIPDYAFYECQNIKTIIMCDGIKSIGREAFSGCNMVQELNIPEGVEKIGYRAFFNCDKLSSLVLPKSYKIIGKDTFNSFSVDNLYYKGEIQDWCKIEYEYPQYDRVPDLILKNVNHFYLKSGENWIEPTEITIPSSVKTIHPYTFAYFKAPKLTIPNNRTNLMVGAFYKYTNLKELEFPSPLEPLSWYYQEHYRTQAFQSEDIKVETLVINNRDFVIKEAFCNCNSLINVTLADSIKTIGDFAFWSCENLKTITWSKRLEAIGKTAFNSCISLTQLDLPASVKTLGDLCFCYTGLQKLVLPSTLMQIGAGCFENCPLLEEVYMPDILSIGEKPFYRCGKLKKMSIPYLKSAVVDIVTDNEYRSNKLEWLEIRGGQSIGSDAFEGCYYLKELIMGDGIKSIQQNSLQGAYNLTKLILSKDITTLPQNFLINQTALKELAIPKATTYLGYYFGATNYLKQYEKVPVSLITVEILGGNSVPYNWAAGCYNITSLILPDTLTSWPNMVSVSGGADKQFSVENLYYKGTLKQWCEDIQFNGSAIPYVIRTEPEPQHHFYLYNENDEWEEVINLKIAGGITSIGAKTFARLNCIETLEIAGQVEAIGEGAFVDCNFKEVICNIVNDKFSLINGELTIEDFNIDISGVKDIVTRVFIGESVTSIPDYGLNSYSSLTSVEFMGHSSCVSIGNYAFGHCEHVEEIIIPQSVETISNYAFVNCYNLRSLIFEEGSKCKSIGLEILSGCKQIQNLQVPFLGAQKDLISGTSYSIGYFFPAQNSDTVNYYSALQFIWNEQTTVYIPNTLTSLTVLGGDIGVNALRNCISLTKVELKGSTEIRTAAISGCTNLTELVLPETLINIVGDSAFANNTSLTKITLPSNVQKLGSMLFMGTPISELTCLATTPPSGGLSLNNNNLTAIYVPVGSVEVYKTAEGWNYYADKIVEIS